MTIREQAKQKSIDQIFLPDHDMPDLFAQRRNPLTEPLHFGRNFLSGFHVSVETEMKEKMFD